MYNQLPLFILYLKKLCSRVLADHNDKTLAHDIYVSISCGIVLIACVACSSMNIKICSKALCTVDTIMCIRLVRQFVG